MIVNVVICRDFFVLYFSTVFQRPQSELKENKVDLEDKSINSKCSKKETNGNDKDENKFDPIQSYSLFSGIKAMFDNLRQELSDFADSNQNENVLKVKENNFINVKVEDNQQKINKENLSLPPLSPKLRKRKKLEKNRCMKGIGNNKNNTPEGGRKENSSGGKVTPGSRNGKKMTKVTKNMKKKNKNKKNTTKKVKKFLQNKLLFVR